MHYDGRDVEETGLKGQELIAHRLQSRLSVIDGLERKDCSSDDSFMTVSAAEGLDSLSLNSSGGGSRKGGMGRGKLRHGKKGNNSEELQQPRNSSRKKLNLSGRKLHSSSFRRDLSLSSSSSDESGPVDSQFASRGRGRGTLASSSDETCHFMKSRGRGGRLLSSTHENRPFDQPQVQSLSRERGLVSSSTLDNHSVLKPWVHSLSRCQRTLLRSSSDECHAVLNPRISHSLSNGRGTETLLRSSSDECHVLLKPGVQSVSSSSRENSPFVKSTNSLYTRTVPSFSNESSVSRGRGRGKDLPISTNVNLSSRGRGRGGQHLPSSSDDGPIVNSKILLGALRTDSPSSSGNNYKIPPLGRGNRRSPSHPEESQAYAKYKQRSSRLYDHYSDFDSSSNEEAECKNQQQSFQNKSRKQSSFETKDDANSTRIYKGVVSSTTSSKYGGSSEDFLPLEEPLIKREQTMRVPREESASSSIPQAKSKPLDVNENNIDEFDDFFPSDQSPKDSGPESYGKLVSRPNEVNANLVQNGCSIDDFEDFFPSEDDESPSVQAFDPQISHRKDNVAQNVGNIDDFDDFFPSEDDKLPDIEAGDYVSWGKETNFRENETNIDEFEDFFPSEEDKYSPTEQVKSDVNELSPQTQDFENPSRINKESIVTLISPRGHLYRPYNFETQVEKVAHFTPDEKEDMEKRIKDIKSRTEAKAPSTGEEAAAPDASCGNIISKERDHQPYGIQIPFLNYGEFFQGKDTILLQNRNSFSGIATAMVAILNSAQEFGRILDGIYGSIIRGNHLTRGRRDIYRRDFDNLVRKKIKPRILPDLYTIHFIPVYDGKKMKDDFFVVEIFVDKSIACDSDPVIFEVEKEGKFIWRDNRVQKVV